MKQGISYVFGMILFLLLTECKKKCKTQGRFTTNSSLIITIKEMEVKDLEVDGISNTIILINDSTSFVAYTENQPPLLEKDFNDFSYILIARGDDLFGCYANSYFLELDTSPTDYIVKITPCFNRVCFPKRPNHILTLIKTQKLFPKTISSSVKK